MIPISISVKNLLEKLQIYSSRRINSHDIKTEIKSDRISIGQQFNNSSIQVNYYEREKENIEEKAIDNDLTMQGRAAFKIDDFPDVWNKVF